MYIDMYIIELCTKQINKSLIESMWRAISYKIIVPTY